MLIICENPFITSITINILRVWKKTNETFQIVKPNNCIKNNQNQTKKMRRINTTSERKLEMKCNRVLANKFNSIFLFQKYFFFFLTFKRQAFNKISEIKYSMEPINI